MHRIFTTWLVFTALFLGACGGGSGGDDSRSVVGIDRIGVSSGTVTGFGSIFVNGVKFETEGTTFTLDDSPGTEEGLSVGDIVVVSGSIDGNGTTGTATTVFSEEAVEGPIDSIDLAISQMVVAGQTVVVDAGTLFDDGITPASLEGLAGDNFVEVHGLFDADQVIRATRIERKAVTGIPAGRFIQIHGVVANVNAADSTFTIGAVGTPGLTISFATADVNDLPGGVPVNGQFVEAKGVSFGASGELIATKVEPETPGTGDLDPADIDDLEIEGYITRFDSATDFDVAGSPVTTNDQTVFEGGTATDLALNVKVEVEGDVNADGTLVAASVEIRRAAVLRITGVVDADPVDDTFVVLGVTVRVDNKTRLEDKSSADERMFSLAMLNAGDYVEVRGAVDANGAGDIIAERLEREDFDTETTLQGFVEPGFSAPTYTVLGVTVDTTNTPIFGDVNDLPLTATEFFDRLQPGDLVKAKGIETSTTTLDANEEVEFED